MIFSKSIKKIVASFGIVLLSTVMFVLGASNKAQAVQIPYEDIDNYSFQNPVFNTYTNVPNGVGNEADFVRIRPSTGDVADNGVNNVRNALYVNGQSAACNVGDKFDIRTYIHNGADDDYNNNGTGTAVAHGTQVRMVAPFDTEAKTFTFTSTISATNVSPVTDTARLYCQSSKNVKLKLVPQSVKVVSYHYDYQTVGDNAVNGVLPIGSRVAGSGDVWACWGERIWVAYVIEVVEIPAPPVPVYTCDALAAVIVGNPNDRKYRFTTNTSVANGATVAGYRYNYGDGTAVTQVSENTQDHIYARSGTYNTSVEAVFNVPNASGQNETKIVGGDNCKKLITVTENPAPVYTCDALRVTLIGGRKFRFEVSATAQNGATVKSYKYEFGDGQSRTIDGATTEYEYTKDGKYTIRATVVFQVGNETKEMSSDACVKTVDMQKPVCDVPGKGNLSKDDPNCKSDEKCTVAGKTNLNKNDANCKETVKSAVTTLPNTGAGSIAGLLAVVTIAGTLAHRWFTLRQINR